MPLFRTLALVALSFAVMGCDSPSPAFRGAEATRVRIDGSVFVVRRLGQEAEAIRTNREAIPNRRDTLVKAVLAIEAATGCTIRPKSRNAHDVMVLIGSRVVYLRPVNMQGDVAVALNAWWSGEALD